MDNHRNLPDGSAYFNASADGFLPLQQTHHNVGFISQHRQQPTAFITRPMTSHSTPLVKAAVYLTASRMKPILITISGIETVRLWINNSSLLSDSQRKRGEPFLSFPELLRRWPIWGKSNVNPQGRATQLSQCTTSTPTHDLLPLVINCTSQFTENGFGGPSKSITDSIVTH